MQGLKQKRKDLGITQGKLARAIGAKKSTVSMWETKNTLPRKDMLDALCKFFNCKIDDLM